MIDPQLLDTFYDWLNPVKYRGQPWEDRGLKEGAPNEALKAYDVYVSMMKKNKAEGIEE